MRNLIEILKFEHTNEHTFLVKKKFTPPKIYIADGNLKKRWYVYFSFRNPKTGKLERMKNIYGDVNTYKTKEKRLALLTFYQRRIKQYLEDGYNPFLDNTSFHKEKQKDLIPEEITNKSKTIQEAFDFALHLKENVLSKTTINTYGNRITSFLNFIKENYPKIKTVEDIDKNIVINFLNSILENTSPRTRNNYRTDLSSIFQVLEDNEFITNNFIKKIPILKTSPTRNKTFSNIQQNDIYDYLEKQDPILLLFIKFISYNFLRPIEVCRLKIRDINLKEKTIQFKAKNSPLKTKIIPDILFQELPDLTKMDPNWFLFTPKKIGGEWDVNEVQKRNYFSKRFKKVVKIHFELGIEYGLYSFRHTFITKLYRNLRIKHSVFEAKSILMGITGHSTMVALEKYLRDIDVELPQDYSSFLE
ncbi:MAG: tyrosine-type recombinase/integrase [Lutibacter sp.]